MEKDDSDNRGNPFNGLPDECILEIFSFNPGPADRWQCAAVCKKWLLLQAHMKRSDFKMEPPSQSSRLRRCLEGSHAVDTRLAAMAVRKWGRGIVGDLSIRGDFLEESSCLPPYGVTDRGLDIVGSGFPCLRSLSLWGCLHITNKGLVCVSKGCAQLEKLDLCECPLITDEGMVAVARGLKKLTTLSLDSCQSIGNISLKAFGTHTPTLHSISVKGCRLVGDEGVLAILAGLPNLKRLRLAQLRSNLHAVLAILRHCKTLTSLSLEDCSFQSSGAGQRDSNCTIGEDQGVGFPESPSRWGLTRIGALGKECANLKNVTISGCTTLNDEELIELGQRVVGLEKLTLEGCKRVSFSGLVEFLTRHAKNLKALKLVKCSRVVEPRNWLPPTSSPSCNRLESLTVGFCFSLRDGFFGWLGRVCCNVREVELVGLRDLSDRGVTGLLMGCGKRTRTLDRVGLNGCSGLTDLAILEIARSFGAELKSVGLSECVGLTSLSLQIIAFYCAELRDLDASGNALKDGDLVHLDRLVWLTNLNLKNCPGLSKKALNSFEGSHFECDLVY
ncbi:EIN3-binding F-box protein 1-like [Nymphaea colorata]|uniref:Uncharacterized protein n=1 Tax=Nymphaea colorata TaxID=210225 RepID=A0A5K0WWI4_9MAGN|nr:EIN3-binding F-box protein 1-like [Nymphaea colorata]